MTGSAEHSPYFVERKNKGLLVVGMQSCLKQWNTHASLSSMEQLLTRLQMRPNSTWRATQ